jgi:uncharacterized membrane protein YoaK (UPF0700 family)
MTGNVVLLAFGATGAQGLPVLARTVSPVVFLVGATAGGHLASRLVGPAGAEIPAPVRRRWVTITLLAELGLVAVAGVVALGLRVGGGGARRYVVIALLAAALGLQNATVRRLAVPDVTTTVLTLTLTGLAADSWLAGGHSPRAGRHLAAVGLMAAGALVGALLLRVDVALPVLAAALLIALAALELRFGREERGSHLRSLLAARSAHRHDPRPGRSPRRPRPRATLAGHPAAAGQPITPLRRARSHRRPRLPGRHRRPAAHRDGCPCRLARPQLPP